MARMTEPVSKWRSDGKWRGQVSGREYPSSKVEEKGGEHWSKPCESDEEEDRY